MNQYALRQISMAVVISLLLSGGVQAATITVTTSADGPLGSITDECTLRAAIAAANNGAVVDGCDSGSSGPDLIVFDGSLAHSTIILSEGQMEITNALAIAGPVPDDAGGMIIDGDQQSRIFRAVGASALPSEFEVRLEGLTLTGGRSTGDGFENAGGAIYARFVDLSLEHASVIGNSTNGIQADSGGLAVRSGNLTLTHTTISGNRTDGPTSPGGGVLVSSGDVVLSYSTVSGNWTELDNARGGGLHIVSGNVAIIHSTVSDNSTAGNFSQGGGLYFSTGDFTLINSTFSGNSTAGTGSHGGGILLSDATATLTHATVAFNTAADGAHGIHNLSGSTLNLNNSLIVQAGAGEAACNFEADSFTQTLATDISCTGQSTDKESIALSPLEDNGGPTQTHALGSGSVAQGGAGDCQVDFGIDTDQRGEPRPATGSTDCDIGAFEVQVVELSPESLDFGESRVGASSAPMTVTLGNLGMDPVAIVATGPIAGPGAGAFVIVQDQCTSAAVPPGGSCSVVVEFVPDNRASFNAEIEFAFDAGGGSITIPMTGTGIAPVMTIQPKLLDFGSVVLGQTGGPLEFELANSGDDLLQVSILFGLAAPFSLAPDGTCQSAPFTLSPGEQCSLQLEFTPGSSGPVKQAVFVSSDSFGGDQAFMLQGLGVSVDIFSDRFEP